MTREKDLKRIVRARMKKTGESYTSARAQITRKSKATKKKTAAVRSTTPTPAAKDYARLAGMNDAVIKAKTGCNWERWVKALDQWGAEKMSHREIADMVNTKWKVDGWWSQTVTVGYERIKDCASADSVAMDLTKQASPAHSTYRSRHCTMRGQTLPLESAGSTTPT